MLKVVLISMILLIPCFWQRRIEAGDLGSHIYNAWLAQQVEQGKMPGLEIAPMTTNVLFDLLLGGLMRVFGPEVAQRIAVSLTVLIFFWGAFRFIGLANWYLTPCLMMLSYGWVFHMGFFNFYLATGLSLWALALRPHWGAIPLLAIAYTGHILPPLWAVAVMAYSFIARKNRILLLSASICGIFALNFWLTHHYRTFASFHQVLEAGAVDQVWVFGLKYAAISILLALFWGFLLLGVTKIKGFDDLSFHLCILTGCAVLILPTRIELPQYDAALSFMTERMTLPYGVLICAFLAGANPPKWLRFSFFPLAAIYFSFLYVDVRSLNKVEASMENLIRPLSTTDRVFTSLDDPLSRVQVWSHMLDRVCVGKCLSYANYEPFSKAFRIRTTGPNPFVIANSVDLGALRDGGYTVKASDIPMYQITLCDSDLCLKQLQVGEVTKSAHLSVAPPLW